MVDAMHRTLVVPDDIDRECASAGKYDAAPLAQD
jgi:hypothetical protein